MGDYRIRMHFDIAAPPSAVTAALTSQEGIASWWSDTVDGQPDKDGGDLFVAFPDLPERFHFRVGLQPQVISWETQDFPPWWKDTTIRWEVAGQPEGDGTALSFTHGGFDPDDDIIPVITPAWAGIIERLKAHAETGARNPFARN